MNDRICPTCGHRLRTRSSRTIASTKEARRECTRCLYRDVATIEPERVVHIRVVPTTMRQREHNPTQ